MDFTFTDEQLAVTETARGVFGGLVTPERVGEVEASEDRVDRDLWAALAAADLLGLAVRADHGGGGLGLTELCLLLQCQANCVAPVPLLATLVLGALPIDTWGTPEQRRRWLPPVVAGEVFLTAGLSSAAESPSNLPSVRAVPDGDGWLLTGAEPAVPQAHVAACIVLPAQTLDGRVLLALVAPGTDGVSIERAETTNREIHPHLHLRQVRVSAADVLVAPDAGLDALRLMLHRAATGLCALSLGVGESALQQTAEYLNQRHQFGRPLSAFQGTMLRAGDAAIDLQAMQVTLWQAAWRLDTGRSADDAVAVAKWQAAERGQRVVHTTQHLHGGIGADVSYPIHRYFLWGKQLELMLGGPSRHLARLGQAIAERSRTPAAAGAR